MCMKLRYTSIIPLLTIPFITIYGLKILHFVSALTSAEKGRDFFGTSTYILQWGEIDETAENLEDTLKLQKS